MKDYIDKINNSKDATSVVQEPASAIAVRQTTKSAKKTVRGIHAMFLFRRRAG